MGSCCSTPSTPSTRSVKGVPRRDPSRSKLKEEREQYEKNTGGLEEYFEMKKYLGSGATGIAWLCNDKLTGEDVAIKLIKRPIPAVLCQAIGREVKIQAQLGAGHINIVKPKDVLLTRTHLGVVMEYVSGGSLADYVLKRAQEKYGSLMNCDGLVLDEAEALYFFQQIVSAMDYCHRHQVAHRDLKLDNTLLDSSTPPRIKVIDFGYANWWAGDAANMQSFIGTLDYMSPQVVHVKDHVANWSYDAAKADIWAVGVLLVVMVTGKFPFQDFALSAMARNLTEKEKKKREENADLELVRSGATGSLKRFSLLPRNVNVHWYDNPALMEVLPKLSDELKDLLDKIFVVDESARISIPDIRAHPWWQQPLPSPFKEGMEEMKKYQQKMDERVAAGVFQNRNRDQALDKIVKMASHYYDVEEQPAAVTRLSQQMVRRISLVKVQSEFKENVDKIVESAGEGETETEATKKVNTTATNSSEDDVHYQSKRSE